MITKGKYSCIVHWNCTWVNVFIYIPPPLRLFLASSSPSSLYLSFSQSLSPSSHISFSPSTPPPLFLARLLSLPWVTVTGCQSTSLPCVYIGQQSSTRLVALQECNPQGPCPPSLPPTPLFALLPTSSLSLLHSFIPPVSTFTPSPHCPSVPFSIISLPLFSSLQLSSPLPHHPLPPHKLPFLSLCHLSLLRTSSFSPHLYLSPF